MTQANRNPVKPQDRAADLYDTWQKYGYVMFPQQRRIYQQLCEKLRGWSSVLEIGCGNGVGTAMLERALNLDTSPVEVAGTDIGKGNVDFALSLYPWIDFYEYDVESVSFGFKFDAVVAVEVLEHVADPVKALRNMLDACTKELWFSTPNGTGKKRPPENPYHVCEYTPREVLTMLGSQKEFKEVVIMDWENFKGVTCDLDELRTDPLVYRVVK